jgi:hypothetical protein
VSCEGDAEYPMGFEAEGFMLRAWFGEVFLAHLWSALLS